MHRWTLTLLLSVSAAAAAWLAPTALGTTNSRGGAPVPPRPMTPPIADLGAGGVDAVDGPLELAVALDQEAIHAAGTARRFLIATITAPAETRGERLPVDLALVMDTSGSMAARGKMTEARRAAAALVSAMGPSDAFSLVTFDDRAQVVRSLGRDPRYVLLDAIEGLTPDGGTNLSDGLLAGFNQARGGSGSVRKVILMTDGQANQGITAPAQLEALARDPSISVSTVGVGLDFNESLLASMADAGRGRYRYVDATTDLALAYAEELESAAHLVALGTQVEFQFADGVVPLRVLQWSADVRGDRAVVPVGDLAAGQSRTVVVEVDVTAMGAARQDLATVTLRGAAVRDEAAFREVASVSAAVVPVGTDLSPYVQREAMTVSTRAVAGWSAMQANQAYQQGDADRGRGLLRAAAGYLETQKRDYGLAIPEADVENLNALGYLSDGEAQKSSYSAGRSMGRSE